MVQTIRGVWIDQCTLLLRERSGLLTLLVGAGYLGPVCCQRGPIGLDGMVLQAIGPGHDNEGGQYSRLEDGDEDGRPFKPKGKPEGVHPVALQWADVKLLCRWAFPRRCSAASVWLMSLCAFAAAFEIIGYFVMQVTAGFSESIVGRDVGAFERDMVMTAIIFSALALILGMKRVSEEFCALACRRSLVQRVHGLYFRSSTAQGLVGRVDNPDQRVASDVDLLTALAAKLVGDTFTAPAAIVYYTWYLWRQLGWAGPVACYAFFVVGVGCNALCARHLIGLVYRQEKLEGQFRYAHAHFRSHLMPILLYRGQAAEQGRIDAAFDRLARNRHNIICRHLPLYISMSFFDYMGSAVAYTAVGVSILWSAKSAGSGDTSAETAGLIAEGIWASLAIIGNMSKLLDSSEALTDLGGYAARVSQLLRVLEEEEGDRAGGAKGEGRGPTGGVAGSGAGEVLMEVQGLSLQTPDGRWLLEDVSFRVVRGGNLLIRGRSGIGKSSLIKALAGLWPYPRKGRLLSCTASVMFLPQDTYCFQGTLLQQVVYPCTVSGEPEAREQQRRRALDCLNDVGLTHLSSALSGHQEEGERNDDEGEPEDWLGRLSRGEAQRLAIARVLFHQPQLAFLDESTNALDEAGEAALYACLRARAITVVSTGHRGTLAAFHTHDLQLGGAAQ